jgi:hypothetical protein
MDKQDRFIILPNKINLMQQSLSLIHLITILTPQTIYLLLVSLFLHKLQHIHLLTHT